ncbi:hypothetical protein NMY22_g2940 [Coprinellus aureogranulatus]|nr:hypothetical protein NMY22_g2940 [Coprinellus aureogranulatus]
MVKLNFYDALAISALAFSACSIAHASGYDLDELLERDTELDSLVQREPGLFDVLKKIPVVGGMFRREVRDELMEIIERDPGLFDVLKKIPVVGSVFGREEGQVAELAARGPGLFDVLKKIPVVGGMFRREIDQVSVRELVEEIELAARDDPEIDALVARDPPFALLSSRDENEVSDLTAREWIEAIDIASREDADVAELVERSPLLGGLIKKIPIVGDLFRRDYFDDSDLDAREFEIGELDELD